MLDLNDFERTFSAYQRTPTINTTGSTDNLSNQQDSTLKLRPSRSKLTLERPKELSVIDGRRAQNLNILLSRYKLSETEITEMVLSMDKDGKLDKDMLEQLIKYVPTPAEKETLESHAPGEQAKFARADRFMLVTSRWEMRKNFRGAEFLFFTSQSVYLYL